MASAGRRNVLLAAAAVTAAMRAVTWSTAAVADCAVTSGGGSAQNPADGATVTCDAAPPVFTQTIGNGSNAAVTVNVEPGGAVVPAASDAILLGDRNTINNEGLIDATGANNGHGIELLDDNSVVNSGVISARLDGVHAEDGNTVVNSGTIAAEHGIVVSDRGVIVNDGAISSGGIGIASAEDPSDLDDPAHDNVIINNGVIGDPTLGIFAGDRNAITNTGRILVESSDITTRTGGILLEADNGLANSGSIFTNRQDADAISVLSGNTITNASTGTLETWGLRADGIRAGDGNVITNSGAIATRGLQADGIEADSGNTIINSGTIQTFGTGLGIFASGTGNRIENAGTVGTSGANADAIATGSGATIANTGTVTTQGALSDGIRTESSSVITNSGQISTQGAGADGIEAGSGNTITNTGTVAAQGDAIGIFAFGTGNTVINSGSITGGRGVAVAFTGGTNTLILQTGSAVDGALVGGTGQDTVFLEGTGFENDPFVDFETLTMRGETWTLNGSSTFTATEIQTGLLNVDGVLTSPVTVNSGAALGGGGTIVGAVTNSGTTAPGGSIGVLTVQGSFTQTATGTLAVEVDNEGQADLLRVTGTPGTATLAGTFQVSPVGGRDTFSTVVEADGGVIGAPSLTTTTDRIAVAARFSAQRIEIATVNPAAVNARTDLGLANGVLFLGAMDARLQALRPVEDPGTSVGVGQLAFAGAGSAAPGRSPVAQAAGTAGSGGSRPAGAWIGGVGRLETRTGDGTVPGHDVGIGGVAVGADYVFDTGFTLGGAFAYTHGSAEVDGDVAEDKADTFQFGAYAGLDADPYFVNAAVAGGFSRNEARRTVRRNGALVPTMAEFDGMTFGARLSGGLSVPVAPRWTMRPVAAVDYVLVDVDGFTEGSGTDGSLVVEDDTAQALRLSGQVTMAHHGFDDFAGTGGTLMPEFRMGLVHELALDDRAVGGRLTGFPGSFILQGDDADRTLASVGLGAALRFDGGFGLFASYGSEFGGDRINHAFTGGVSIAF